MRWGQEKRDVTTEVLGVRLPIDIKRKVLSLPNSTERVRQAILKLVTDNEVGSDVVAIPARDRTLSS